MKRVVIVHCWDGVPDSAWYPWLKKELEGEGIAVEVPAMPETEAPKQKLWVPHLAQLVGTPDEELVLVGHSVGCITILRYLEALGAGDKIAGMVLVAGFTDDLGFEELKNYFETPIDFALLKERAEKIICIFSDNDRFVPLKHADVFRDKLGAEIIIKERRGHFSREDKCVELPDAKAAVLRCYQ